ncbi:uncharacterized protein FRV6_15390 [Fusarium oxysporum]|jgi:hypothetical protein
MPLN